MKTDLSANPPVVIGFRRAETRPRIPDINPYVNVWIWPTCVSGFVERLRITKSMNDIHEMTVLNKPFLFWKMISGGPSSHCSRTNQFFYPSGWAALFFFKEFPNPVSECLTNWSIALRTFWTRVSPSFVILLLPWLTSYLGNLSPGPGQNLGWFRDMASWNSVPLEIAYQILGWTAFLSWSCSFYPQVILNFRRKRFFVPLFGLLTIVKFGFSFDSYVNNPILFLNEFRN